MLRDAHFRMEAMSAAVAALKDERWGDAQRSLQEVQQLIAVLMREVGDKLREEAIIPKPDNGDRG